MSRAVGFAAGFVAFLVAHAIEVARWTAWFGGAHEPWFLNTGASITATMGCVFVASIMVAVFEASSRRVKGVTIGIGAFVAMTLVLFLKPGGPGNIFPIVMAFGAVVLLVSTVAGAWLGRELRRALRRS